MKFEYKELGLDCDFVATAATKEEVMDLAMVHTVEAHDDMLKSLLQNKPKRWMKNSKPRSKNDDAEKTVEEDTEEENEEESTEVAWIFGKDCHMLYSGEWSAFVILVFIKSD